MSQQLNFPNSMNLSMVKETAQTTMRGDFLQFTSQNTTYKARDTIKIPIANASNIWLHGQDSFISMRVKINGASTGGQLALDSTVYSMFKTARLTQGGNTLVEQNECGRLWNALFDLQVSGGDRASKEITMGVATGGYDNFGIFGTPTIDGLYLYFSFPLPMSIVGTLSEKSFPLGAISTGMLLELEIEDVNKFLTTRQPKAGGYLGEQSLSTAISALSVEIDEINYNAKVSNVGNYDQVLLDSLGPSFTIPGVEYRHDKREIEAGKSSITSHFSFPLKSMKNFLFFFTNSQTANGEIVGGKLNNAITQRTCGGNLKDYSLRIDGTAFPSQAISASAGANLALNTLEGINSSLPFQHLLRAFNLNSSVSSGGILTYDLYSSPLSTYADDALYSKRCLMGIDLDRGSNDSDKYFMGVNVQNAVTSLYLNWNTSIVESQTLYTYVMHDVGFIVEQGVCFASK